MRSLVTLFFLLLALSHAGASAQSTEIRGPKEADNSEQSRAIGPIKPSDTLWRIAAKVRPDNSVTMYQVMVALYEKNPNSFLDNNLNHMRDGAYLQIPSMREIRTIDPRQAKAKSELDDKLWSNIKDSKTSASAVPASTARQQQAAQAKQELELELERLKQEQSERLVELQQQLSTSLSHAESILIDNDRLRAQLQKITEQLTQVQAQLDEKDAELQQQLQQFMAERQAMARQQQIQQEQNASWFNALPGWLSLLLMMTLPALAILALVVMFLKKRGKEEAPNPAAEEQSTAVSQPVAVAESLNGLDELDLTQDDDSLEDLPLEEPFEKSFDDTLDEPLDDFLDEPLDEPLDEVFSEPGIQLDEQSDDVLYGDNSDAKNIDSLLGQDELDDLLADDVKETFSSEEEVLQQNFDLSSLDADTDNESLDDSLDALSDAEIDDLFATEASASDELDIDDLLDDLPQEDDIDFDAEDELLVEPSVEPAPSADQVPSAEPEPSADQVPELVEDLADEFDIDDLLDEVQGEEISGEEDELLTELLPEDLPEHAALAEDEFLPEDLPAPLADLEPSAEQAPELVEDLADEFDIDDLLDEVQQGENPLDELEEQEEKKLSETDKAELNAQPLEDELGDALALGDDLDAGDDPLAQLDELFEEQSSALPETSSELSAEPASEALSADSLGESLDVLDSDADDTALEIDLGDDPLLADDDLEEQTNLESFDEQVDLGDVDNPSAQLEDYPELEMDEPFSSATEQQLSEAMAENDGFDIDAMLTAEYDEDSALDDEQVNEDFLADLSETDFDAMLDELAESPTQPLERDDIAGDLDLQALLHDADDDQASSDAAGDEQAGTENATMAGETSAKDQADAYVDIDDLLAQSDEAELDDEPYKDANMDVGLGEFDDLLEDTPKTDVDTQDGGFSAKLDLARAYLEIDDVDSALEALQEVLDNGPQTLQQEAQALKERLTN